MEKESRSGFSAVLIIFAVLALIIAGAIAYVHLVVLPRMNAAASSPAASPVQTSSSTPATAAAGNAPAACTDLKCFIAYAETCTPIDATITDSLPFLYPGVLQNSVTEEKIGGFSGADCLYSDKVLSAEGVVDQHFFDPSNAQNALKEIASSIEASAKTSGGAPAGYLQSIETAYKDGSLLKQAQSTVAQMNQQLPSSIGSLTSCVIPTSTLVQRLQDEENGTINIQYPDPYCKVTFAAATSGGYWSSISNWTAGTSAGLGGQIMFTINAIGANSVSVTADNESTGQSAQATLGIGQTTTMVGYEVVLTEITPTGTLKFQRIGQ